MKHLIKQQFKDSLQSGVIPCLEYSINRGQGDWLVVDIDVTDRGVEFSFDTNDLECFFEGDVIQSSENVFYIPFCEYTDHLDQYLEQINDNITEGYLIANSLI